LICLIVTNFVDLLNEFSVELDLNRNYFGGSAGIAI